MSMTSKMKRIGLCVVLFLTPIHQALAEYSLEKVAGGLDVPWGLVQLPGGDLLVSERDGRLLRIGDGGSGNRTTVNGVPKVYDKGQGGLFDLALHPDFDNNQWLYFSYARPGRGGAQTAVGRGRLVGSELIEVVDVFAPAQRSRGGRHFGSRIAFDREGFLFVSVGDRGDRDRNSQDLTRVAGKIHRVHDDGRVPADNPFVGSGDDTAASVWSSGHRNPQGMVIDPLSDSLLSHEHGPKGGDELNLVSRGANYGWPLVTFGVNYIGTEITPDTERAGMVSPLLHWTPSIAPSGLAVAQDPNLPNLLGDLLVGSLKFAEIHRVTLDASRTRVLSRDVLMPAPGRVRNIASGIDGSVFIAISGSGLYKLVAN